MLSFFLIRDGYGFTPQSIKFSINDHSLVCSLLSRVYNPVYYVYGVNIVASHKRPKAAQKSSSNSNETMKNMYSHFGLFFSGEGWKLM